jgi:hypothetical protein
MAGARKEQCHGNECFLIPKHNRLIPTVTNYATIFSPHPGFLGNVLGGLGI